MAEEAFSLKDAIALYSGKIDLSPCAAGRGGILRLRAATCAPRPDIKASRPSAQNDTVERCSLHAGRGNRDQEGG